MENRLKINLKIVNKYMGIFLGAVVFISQISQIYVFSNNKLISAVTDIIDLFCYLFFFIVVLLKYKKGVYIEYTRNPRKKWFILGIFFIFAFGYFFSRNTVYIKGLIMILACKESNFSKILKSLLYGFLSILIFSIILYILGISDVGAARRGGLSLGFVHPNILAQFILMIDLLFISLYGYKLNEKKIFGICFGTGIIEYLITKSRTTTILIFLIPCLFFLVKFLVKHRKEQIVNKIGEWSYPAILGFTVLTAYLYPFDRFSQLLNKVVNSRIFLNYYILTTSPPTLLGQNVSLQNNTGEVYDAVTKVGNIHTTVDNSYMISLIILGIIPTLIIAVLYYLTIKKMINRKNYTLIIVAFILCTYGFCEAQMVPFYNFFILFYLFSSHNQYDELNKRRFYDT